MITSRSARAAVLIPAIALPVAGFGRDPALIVMVAVLGTGFCQTMMVTSKPIAIYGNLDQPTFSQRDLFRLALPLMPVVARLLIMTALVIWPHRMGLASPSSLVTPEMGMASPAMPTLARAQNTDTTFASQTTVNSPQAPEISPRPLPCNERPVVSCYRTADRKPGSKDKT